MTTKKTDLLIPEVLLETVKGQFAGAKALAGTAAVSMDFSMPSTKGGEEITVPYFGTIGEFEDISTEGDALTPATLSMTHEHSSVQHAGKAFEITEWARMAAQYADPYGEAARQIVEGAVRRFDKALIDVAAASLSAAGMVKDLGEAQLDYDGMVDAKMLWGDEQENISLMVVHSATAGRLMKLKDNNGRPLLVMPESGKLGNFCGVPLGISDRNAPVAGVYTSMIFKRGALALWANGTPSIDVDKDILADTRVAACHIYFVAHRYSRLNGSTKGGVVHIKHK